MKSLLIGGIASTAMGLSAAFAQSTADPAKNANAAPGVVTSQPAGTMRAPKLVGVAVYDRDNKSVGKVADLLLDNDGKIETVVIGVGGFLGIGSKDIAVPYSAIQWKTEPRTVAANTASPGGPASGTGGSTMAPNGTAASNEKPATKTVDPAKTEAYQGYPDKAVLNMSEAELKAAPEFRYAANPA